MRQMTRKNIGYGVEKIGEPLRKLEFETRAPAENELLLEVIYSAICHSDIHIVKGELTWPLQSNVIIPGHEYIGRVMEIGPMVEIPGESKGGRGCKKYAVGEYVGCHGIFETCRSCGYCSVGDEFNCPKKTFFVGQVDKYGAETHGGFAKYALVNRFHVITLPQNQEKLKSAAPLMCAGGTAWAPVARERMERGHLKIGVIGLGGLGHMAVQYAARVNPTNEVVVLSRTSRKKALSLKLGAKRHLAIGQAILEGFADVKNATPEVLAELDTFDYLIDTVAAHKPVALYLAFLKPRGQLLTLGVTPHGDITQLPCAQLLLKQLCIQGIIISGTNEIQDAVDFAFKHDCMPMVEHIKFEQLNDAFRRCIDGTVEFRFVIDVKGSFDTP